MGPAARRPAGGRRAPRRHGASSGRRRSQVKGERDASGRRDEPAGGVVDGPARDPLGQVGRLRGAGEERIKRLEEPRQDAVEDLADVAIGSRGDGALERPRRVPFDAAMLLPATA